MTEEPIDVSAEELGGLLRTAVTRPETSQRPLAFLVRAADVASLDAVGAAVSGHADLLARGCVGVAVVSADSAVREIVLAHSGTLGFPITALADETDARGWLAGQLAAGVAGVRPRSGTRTIGITPVLADYIRAHTQPGPDPVATRLAAATVERYPDESAMNIPEDQGRLLTMLVSMTGARHVIEVGTFTGMSAMWLARGLEPNGRLTCFEAWEDPLQIARVAWAEAGVADRIDVVIGPAEQGLAGLPSTPGIDLAFIDADKPNNTRYIALVLERLAPNGLILLDNTLWGGAVADDRDQDADTIAIRNTNTALAARTDLEVSILPIGDGLTIIRRR